MVRYVGGKEMWSRKRKETDVTNKSFGGQIGIYELWEKVETCHMSV